MALVGQNNYVVRGTFVERSDDSEDASARRCSMFKDDTCINYGNYGHTDVDDCCDSDSDSDASTDAGCLSDFESPESSPDNTFTPDCFKSEYSDSFNSDSSNSEAVEIIDLSEPTETRPPKSNIESLEAQLAALTENAQKLRVAAQQARQTADAAKAQYQPQYQRQYQHFTAEASSRRPTFSKRNASAKAGSVAFQPTQSLGEPTYTTLMCKNVPNDYSRNMFTDMLDSEGLAGLYDFVYVPRDFKKSAGFGYAFVNFQTHAGAVSAMQCLQGFARWTVPTRKVLEVVWSSPHQGLSAHVDRYRNSPIMHAQMPEDYKPILLKDGVRIEFPHPTARIRAPYQGKNNASHQ